MVPSLLENKLQSTFSEKNGVICVVGNTLCLIGYFINLYFSVFVKSDYDSSLIAERPLLTQVYSIIQQAGPCGFTLSVSFILFIPKGSTVKVLVYKYRGYYLSE